MSPISFLEFGTFCQTFGAMQGAAFPFATSWDEPIEENHIPIPEEGLKVNLDYFQVLPYDCDFLKRLRLDHPDFEELPELSYRLPSAYRIFEPECPSLLAEYRFFEPEYPSLPAEYRLFEPKCPSLPVEYSLPEEILPADEAISPSPYRETYEPVDKFPSSTQENVFGIDWNAELESLFLAVLLLSSIFLHKTSKGIHERLAGLKGFLRGVLEKMKSRGQE